MSVGDNDRFLGLLRQKLQYAIQWLPSGAISEGKIRRSATVGQVLTTTANGTEWQDNAGGGGVSDHGALTGLADDDHTQYHNDTRGDARYSLLGHNHSGTYQPLDGDLTTIAGLTATTDNFLQAKAGAWSSRTVAQVVSDLDAGGLAPKASPALTGTPTAPTAAAATDTTQIATTAFVKDQKLHDFTLPTAATPMNSQKFTGLAAGSANGDSLRYEQLFTTSNVGLLAGLNAAFGYAVNVGVTAGSPQAQLGAVGGASTVGLYSDYSHTQPKTMLSSYSGLSFGDGSSSAVDWNLSRTAANEATVAAGDVLKHDTAAENSANTVVATTAYVDRATGNASSNRPMANVARTSAQSLAITTWTAIQFDTELTDTDSMWTSGSNTRLTATTAGNYIVTGHVNIDNTAANQTHAARIVHKNSAGTVQAYYSAEARYGAVDIDGPTLGKVLALAAGDYVELQAYSSVATNTVVFSNTHHASFSMAWVGGTGAAWGNAGARAARSSNQTLTTATHTSVLFDTEDWDVDGMHSTSSNTNRLTATVAGTYAITAMVAYTANATGDRGTRILKNGSEIVGYNLHAASTAPNTTRQTVTAIVQMVAGDYVEVTAYQASGGNLDIIGAAAGSERTTLSAVRVGYQTNPADLPGTYIASMYAANSGAPTHTTSGSEQKVGSGGGTLTWTSEIDKRPSGVSAQVDTATNKRIDIRKTGLYRVTGSVGFAAISDAKTVSVAVYKNGARIMLNATAVGKLVTPVVETSKIISLTSGDYLELYGNQDDSASEAYFVGLSTSCMLQVEYLGPAT